MFYSVHRRLLLPSFALFSKACSSLSHAADLSILSLSLALSFTPTLCMSTGQTRRQGVSLLDVTIASSDQAGT